MLRHRVHYDIWYLPAPLLPPPLAYLTWSKSYVFSPPEAEIEHQWCCWIGVKWERGPAVHGEPISKPVPHAPRNVSQFDRGWVGSQVGILFIGVNLAVPMILQKSSTSHFPDFTTCHLQGLALALANGEMELRLVLTCLMPQQCTPFESSSLDLLNPVGSGSEWNYERSRRALVLLQHWLECSGASGAQRDPAALAGIAVCWQRNWFGYRPPGVRGFWRST